MRLRIISGEFKGRLINVPQTDKTRPTTDRVRESIFNYLMNKIDLDGANVLDMYSGSGSLGFEALSRGAASVMFIEKSSLPYRVLNENIAMLNSQDRCKIVRTSATVFTEHFTEQKFDLILADPPFFSYDIYDAVKNIKQNQLIAPEGLMIIERSIQTLDKDIRGFGFEPYRRLGDTCLFQLEAPLE
ncbi:MAG: 16S rRNA (guanine(966)-N(2))-methyltransferase RsmD [Ignavibacteria bacterium]|nr:16S rRNA (guanine(966)-N(2))-methyltransferase RsmD [Ignavibacteria bacterium]